MTGSKPIGQLKARYRVRTFIPTVELQQHTLLANFPLIQMVARKRVVLTTHQRFSDAWPDILFLLATVSQHRICQIKYDRSP